MLKGLRLVITFELLDMESKNNISCLFTFTKEPKYLPLTFDLLLNTDEYSKTCLKGPLKNKQNKDLNNKWQLNEGQKYCRMLPLEHSALPSTCIK